MPEAVHRLPAPDGLHRSADRDPPGQSRWAQSGMFPFPTPSSPPAEVAGVPVPPVPGAILDEFRPPDPDWLPGHRGLDLGADPGVPVTSPAAGVVAYAGKVAGVEVVAIQHGAARATYQPVRTGLRVGDPVHAGQVIGAISESGGHCGGTCLHWGLIVAERYADPRLLLGTARVRLVPDPP